MIQAREIPTVAAGAFFAWAIWAAWLTWWLAAAFLFMAAVGLDLWGRLLTDGAPEIPETRNYCRSGCPNDEAPHP